MTKLSYLAASGFQVDSDTQITAVVPAGAATGRIRIDRTDVYVRSTTDFTVVTAAVRRRAARMP